MTQTSASNGELFGDVWEGADMFNKHGVPRSRIEFLQSVKLFEGLPTRVLERLDSHLDEVDLPAGSRLTSEGTNAYETFIVLEGTASVDVNGTEVAEVGVGELVGEVAVLQHSLRTATVTATTPMRLLVIASREIEFLLSDDQLSERVRDNLSRHLNGSQPSS